MTDLLGPANAANSTTTRPTDARVFGGSDTFFKDCSSPTARDGTVLTASYLNGMLMQIRRAIRGMGITENNADDDMLLKALQASGAGKATEAGILSYNGLFPYSGITGGVTATTGQVVINSSVGNWVIFRGYQVSLSTNLTAGQRTFATAANKTYHLRWRRTTGPALLDLADPAYNPSALPETSAGFDSNFDDCLYAKVVTNGSNVPTVTLLSNFPLPLKSEVHTLVNTVFSPGWTTIPGTKYIFNWGRTPVVSTALSLVSSSVDRPDGSDIANTGLPGYLQMVAIRAPNVTRYGSDDLQYAYDDSQNTEGRYGLEMIAIA